MNKGTLKTALMVVGDVVISSLCLLLAHTISAVDKGQPINYLAYLLGIPVLAVVLLAIYYFFKVYRIMWQFARVTDGVKFSLVTLFAFLIFIFNFSRKWSYPATFSRICGTGIPTRI